MLTWLASVVLAIRALHQAVRRYRAAALRSPGLDRGDTGRAYVSLDGPTAVNLAPVITFLAVVLGRPADDGGLTWFGVPLFATGRSPRGSCCWSGGGLDPLPGFATRVSPLSGVSRPPEVTGVAKPGAYSRA